jgi:hypothetical protein
MQHSGALFFSSWMYAKSVSCELQRRYRETQQHFSSQYRHRRRRRKTASIIIINYHFKKQVQ